MVKAGWGQIRETLERKIREWGLYSVSSVESLKASGKERLFRKDRPVSDMQSILVCGEAPRRLLW